MWLNKNLSTCTLIYALFSAYLTELSSKSIDCTALRFPVKLFDAQEAYITNLNVSIDFDSQALEFAKCYGSDYDVTSLSNNANIFVRMKGCNRQRFEWNTALSDGTKFFSPATVSDPEKCKIDEDGVTRGKSASIDATYVSIPDLSDENFSVRGGTFGNLEAVDVDSREQYEPLNVSPDRTRMIVRVPLHIAKASGYYAEYHLPSKKKQAGSLIVIAEELKFKLDLYMEKYGAKCKCTVLRLTTVHPGMLKKVMDQASKKSVEYPLEKMIRNTWGKYITRVLEVELYKVLERRLKEIDC